MNADTSRDRKGADLKWSGVGIPVPHPGAPGRLVVRVTTHQLLTRHKLRAGVGARDVEHFKTNPVLALGRVDDESD